MNQITQTAPTKEEAINVALEKLGVTRQEVSIIIVDEGKKGFFGFGAKPAVVEVTVLENEEVIEEVTIEKEVEITEVPKVLEENPSNIVNIGEIVYTEGTNDHAIEEATKYIHKIAKEMNIDDLTINQRREGKFIHLHLDSKKAALLIGKRGQTLNALENLTQLVANKFSNSFMIIKVDVGNYRERRQETLEQLADRMADKVVSTGKKEKLEPMSSYERKIIHNALSTRLDIETYSVGTDPNRYLVIEPIK
ncbi:RNA-binding cell elongation regulator Jag/EloR [Psychrobacillus sp.]|uniref:RNA-binding cell elongation regulator Jag/EloR n=1 Tax=Psychrobacillus sp. TaxID=1871623 RepID=UPI0028BE24C2|nr:RNA-binding cell elongation regulator Jag/EloR [Psychrobacillus sp.]